MKEPLRRTKVLIRHLPPSLSQSELLSLFNDRFADCYNWFCFRPGKSSHVHQRYSRAYVILKNTEDVLEFAELLNGHVFVNEKGAQFKAIVEYAPSQRVPNSSAKRDSREGTILRDPDYLQFLKLIAKPVENLPSAEIQLERKEAELSGAAKESPIVTPLMEYVRHGRATESGTQGSLAVRKSGRRSRASSTSKSGSSTTKRVSEKKKYILKNSEKNASWKDKSTVIAVPKQENQPAFLIGKEMSEVPSVEGFVSGITLTSDTGKKKILLLKGKGRETSHVPNALLHKQGETSPVENSTSATAPKQIQRCEAGGKLIKKVLSQQMMQTLNLENGKPPPASINSQSVLNGHVSNNDSPAFISDIDTKRTPDDRFVRKVLYGSGAEIEKHKKLTRNKDRPDHGVWTRHSDISQAYGEHSSSLHPIQKISNSTEVNNGDIKDDISSGGKNTEVATPASGGSHRNNGRCVAAHIIKDDGSISTIEGKSSKRKSGTGSGAQEMKYLIGPESLSFPFSPSYERMKYLLCECRNICGFQNLLPGIRLSI